MARHTISHADQLFYGNSKKAAKNNARRGVRFHPATFVDLGAPVALSATALLNAATSTELPNAATITYTFPSAGASPQDGTLGTTGTLDVPRNLTFAASHASAVLAMTIVATGTDENGDTLTETFSIAAGGTAQSATGKKAFKQVTSLAITAAGNATTNTLNGGFGDSLGLPLALADARSALLFIDGVPQTTLGTLTAADTTTPATSSTGDVRGTWLPNTATNGTRRYTALLWNIPVAAEADSASSAFGVRQA